MDAQLAVMVNVRNYLKAVGGIWKGEEGAARKIHRTRKSLKRSIGVLRNAGYSAQDIVECTETKIQAIVVQDLCDKLMQEAGN